MRITLQMVHDSDVPANLNLCSGDPKITEWANDFQEFALNQGVWWGTRQRANFCLNDSCFAMPREVAAIEAIASCGQAYQIQTMTYQIQGPTDYQCPSCKDSSYGCGHLTYEDRGQSSSASVTRKAGSKIRAYARHPNDYGKKINLQGYDKNRIWVRTSIGGIITDGEQLTLSGTPVNTVTEWYPGAPSLVIKDPTDYPVLIYELDAGAGERLLSNYQPSETHPAYRVGFIPGIPAGCCCDGDSPVMSLNAVVSLDHIPVQKPNDFFLLQNFVALKQGIAAMKHRSDGNTPMQNLLLYGSQMSPAGGRNATRSVPIGGAIPMLKAQQIKMSGSKADVIVRFDAGSRGFKHTMAWFR